MNLDKVLVTGAGGMVGHYIDFGMRYNHHQLDVMDREQVLEVVSALRPEAIVHLAGATDVDRCEGDFDYSDINVRGTYNVAMAARLNGARMIYVSTVYVFDGSKNTPYVEGDEPTIPLTKYGFSKLVGEKVAAVANDLHVFRAGWMFGGGETDTKFVAKIVKQLQGSNVLNVATDLVGSLTYAKDLARWIKRYLEGPGENRLVHVFNKGVASRFDVALEIAKNLGYSTDRIVPVHSSFFDKQLAAKRSKNDSMHSVHLGTMRPWQEALAEYLREWTHGPNQIGGAV